MSRDAQIAWLIVGIIVAFVLIVWFLSSVLDILRQNPKPLWFVLGILATLVFEAVVYLGIIIVRRLRSNQQT